MIAQWEIVREKASKTSALRGLLELTEEPWQDWSVIEELGVATQKTQHKLCDGLCSERSVLDWDADF